MTPRRPRLELRRGQSVVEYMLVIAAVALVSMGFSAFFSRNVMGEGLKELPDQAQPLVSHGD